MVDKNKFAEVEGYNISFTGRNVLVTEAMSLYLHEKLAKIDRFCQDVIDIHVTMDVQKMEHKVDFLMKVGHIVINVHSTEQDMYASIDKGVDKLQTCLRKYKSRLQEHHVRVKGVLSEDLSEAVITAPADFITEINDAIDEENRKEVDDAFAQPHQVVTTERRSLKTLTQDEAIMRLELSGDTFLIYRSEEDQKIKVAYRRPDTHYGIVETG